jgi:hypothetical protein
MIGWLAALLTVVRRRWRISRLTFMIVQKVEGQIEAAIAYRDWNVIRAHEVTDLVMSQLGSRKLAPGETFKPEPDELTSEVMYHLRRSIAKLPGARLEIGRIGSRWWVLIHLKHPPAHF